MPIRRHRGMAPRGRAIRLAVVSDAVLPWHQGGKEQRHHELYTRLARRGFEVTVYTMRWWSGPKRIERDGISYVALCRHLPIYHGPRRSISQALVFALSCFGLLWRRFDVVEADAIPFLPLVPVRLVTWVRRRPMVTTWHEFWGPEYWRTYLGARGRIAAVVEASAVRLPDRIIAASEETASRLRAAPRGPRDVVVIPNGVTREMPVTVVAPTSRPTGSVRLVVAGRLLENKRIDLGLRAVRILVDRGLDVVFDVVGDGPEMTRLSDLAATLDLTDRVRFTGFLPTHGDVLAAMASADLLLFTSVREGFGMVALEAMAVGTPVVAADHPDNAARHLVREGVNGQLATVSAEGFADAVELALAAGDRLTRGALASATDYDWERLAERAADAYRSSASPDHLAPVQMTRPLVPDSAQEGRSDQTTYRTA